MLNEQNEGLDDNESNNGTARQQSGGEAGRRANREGSGAADVGLGGGGAGGAHEPSLSATIPLTPQDRQAIERVSGFKSHNFNLSFESFDLSLSLFDFIRIVHTENRNCVTFVILY